MPARHYLAYVNPLCVGELLPRDISLATSNCRATDIAADCRQVQFVSIRSSWRTAVRRNVVERARFASVMKCASRRQ